ncbi:conserved hypothetical protein [Burkholderia pseudomallei MSHR346]|nr:conserved hypothetical protein [Burkholderia pseudomallei MSHR346]
MRAPAPRGARESTGNAEGQVKRAFRRDVKVPATVKSRQVIRACRGSPSPHLHQCRTT